MGRRNRKRQAKGKDKRGPLEAIGIAIELTEWFNIYAIKNNLCLHTNQGYQELRSSTNLLTKNNFKSET
jgi:hypothetical protein